MGAETMEGVLSRKSRRGVFSQREDRTLENKVLGKKSDGKVYVQR